IEARARGRDDSVIAVARGGAIFDADAALAVKERRAIAAARALVQTPFRRVARERAARDAERVVARAQTIGELSRRASVSAAHGAACRSERAHATRAATVARAVVAARICPVLRARVRGIASRAREVADARKRCGLLQVGAARVTRVGTVAVAT